MSKAVMALGLWVLVGLGFGYAQESSPAATVAEAQAVLDLSAKPLAPPVGATEMTVAYQNLETKGNPDVVAKAIDKTLVGQGFKQLPNAIFQESYSSASYEKNGFIFTVSTMPSGNEGTSTVTAMNLGNVDFKKLLKFKGLKEVFVQAPAAIFSSDLAVPETNAKVREVLEADGWEWFGETTVSFFMRKNAVRLQIMCSDAPNQKGKSMVQLSSEQMSSTLPFPKDLKRINYTDSQMTLEGDSPLQVEALFSEYRKLLEAQGWKATTDQPLEIDHRQHLIFRNPKDELAELRIHTFDDLSRFELQFMTAAQVQQEDARAQKAADEAKAKMAAEQERMNNPTPIVLEKIEGAKLQEETAESLEFQVKSGSAQTSVNKWLKALEAQGWKVDRTIDTKEAGDFNLTKDDATLSVGYMDPGFIPGEITVRTQSGFKLELKK